MLDLHGRKINYLRLSVTEACNMKCRYCVPSRPGQVHTDTLTAEQIAQIVRVMASIGIDKVRLTGGEPLLRPDIVPICSALSALVKELCITTNATLLGDLAVSLKKSGVRGVNISLDTLSPEKYQVITGTDLHAEAMRGIDSALSAGFGHVKINAVLMRGVNDSEIPELVGMAHDLPVDVRFIEAMPANPEFSRKVFMPCSEVLKHFPQAQYSGFEGTAEIYTLPGAKGRLGLISPVSCRFCSSCNRLRLTSDGKLKPCLYTANETRIEAMNDSSILKAVSEALAHKPQHRPETFETSEIRTMTQTGG